jgi:hypothetical protein
MRILIFFSFELSGPFDEHQEQNARREAGRFILNITIAVARRSFHQAPPHP